MRMKRIFAALCVLWCFLCAGCSPLLPLGCILLYHATNDGDSIATTPNEETQPQVSHQETDENPRITCGPDEIVISLYENQAVPFRWESRVSDGGQCLELAQEETEDGPSAPFSAGDSPARHVFYYRWIGDGEATIELKNLYLQEYRESPQDESDYMEKHVYVFSRYDGVTDYYEEF